MKIRLQLLLCACLFFLTFPVISNAQTCTPVAVTKTNATKVYIHYMPWFFAPRNPVAGTDYTVNNNATGSWGFHWCEDGSGANPNTFTTLTDYTGATVQARNVDAHFHPLIGPYDGSDPNVLEYHFLLMKLSGADGIIIDWYGLAGNSNDGDAGANQVNSAALISSIGNYGLKYGLMIEDGSMSNLPANLSYAASNYFTDPNYIKLGDMRGSTAANATAPLCAAFEPGSYPNASSWSNLGNTKAFLPIYGQAWNTFPSIAGGTFMWPYPQAGQSGTPPAWYTNTSSYYSGNATTIHNDYQENGVTLYNNVVLGTAYQGFFDFYLSNANSFTNPNADVAPGVDDHYGIIPRNYGSSGNTLTTMLNLAQSYKTSSIIDGIQIATWNDFTEGTIVEPTVEYGFQSLVAIQQFTGVPYTEKDLRYVDTLFMLRKQYANNTATQAILNQAACDFGSLQVTAAEALLDCVISNGGGTCSNFPPIINSFTPSNGTDGSVITIRGLYFTGITAVSFGGKQASSFTVVSDSVITATIIGGATGIVSVTDSIGAGTDPGFLYLPFPWKNKDVGRVAAVGSSYYLSDTFHVAGSGGDIYGIADACQYMYQPVSGNLTITARVISLDSTNVWAKAGLMFRDSLTAGSTNITEVITPDTGINFQYRTVSTNATTNNRGNALQTPYWLRIIRVGNLFTSYYSPDGNTWTRFDTITIVMANNIYVGAVVTSHDDGVIANAVFANVTVQSTPFIISFTPNNGVTGSVVTIRGLYFTGATSVSFGGTAASSFTVVSDSVITAVVGTGSLGIVAVSNSFGTGMLAGFNYYLCPGTINTSLISNSMGTSYQWQVNTGTGFTNISNGTNYSGATNLTLSLVNIPTFWYGYQYRCLVGGNNYSNTFTLIFSDTWTGAGGTSAWENGANWSCGVLPDRNTDVIINNGIVVLSSNVAIRILTVNPSASFTIVTPYNLTVTH
jgi:hypothetical protein